MLILVTAPLFTVGDHPLPINLLIAKFRFQIFPLSMDAHTAVCNKTIHCLPLYSNSKLIITRKKLVPNNTSVKRVMAAPHHLCVNIISNDHMDATASNRLLI